MKNLYIVGAGGFGRELLNIILNMQAATGPKWNIIGFLDDTEDPLKGKACAYGVVGSIVDFFPGADDVLAMGIADPFSKQCLASMLKSRGAVFENVIHHTAYLGCNNTIGEGVVAYGGFSMSVNVTIGNFVTLLPCGLGHDVVVEDYCTISTSTNLLGAVHVGKQVFIGANVAVAPHVNIGDGAYICMGSMVMKNVPAGAKVLGNPAKIIGEMASSQS